MENLILTDHDAEQILPPPALFRHDAPMTKPSHSKPPQDSDPAFYMEPDDRFHSILVSDGVRYETNPDTETVLTFFVIRRANGLHEIVNVMKTFKADKCTLRNVQAKADIPAHAIAMEVAMVVSTFGDSIREKTGFQMRWHRLDLMNVESRDKQVKIIKEWNRVGVRTDFR